jgi:LysR family transcriptional regulator, nitrogen assimilation regulatory protein
MDAMGQPIPNSFHLAADLQRWRAFVAIADFGSLTRAAVFLDTTQSILSRQLNALERDCGARLFNRTGRGMTLSDVGQRIMTQVRALLTEAERLEAELSGDAQVPTGVVTVASLPSISQPIVGQLFSRLRAQFPGIHLKILEGSSGQVEEWLADARVDIAILYRYGTHTAQHEQTLAVVDSYLIGSRSDKRTRSATVPLSALEGLPFILPSAPNGLRTALDTMARQKGIRLQPVIEADSLPLMRCLVETEQLYTVLPVHAVWQEVKDGRLQASRIVDPPFQRTVSMAFSRTKGVSRAVSLVAAQIVSIVQQSALAGMWRADVANTPPSESLL